MTDELFSPFGCYYGKFLDRFRVVDAIQAQGLDKELDAWEVAVMVRARSPQEAYDRLVEIAERDTRHYHGELDGVSIEWQFAGITELEPVMHDPFIDSDFIYLEHNEVRLRDHLPYLVDRQQLHQA